VAKRAGTRFTIYAAAVGNLSIAAIKFGAALHTGSSAMLSDLWRAACCQAGG